MSLDLRELYQETILDHNRRPAIGEAGDPTGQAEGHNPLCGDQVEVTLVMEGNVVREIAFDGQGLRDLYCERILMTEAVKGKTRQEAEQIFRDFQHMVTETGEPHAHAALGDLEVLAGVREYPVRIKCATLPWHTFHAALQGGGEVSTE